MRIDSRRGWISVLFLTLALGATDLLVEWHHIYWGPAKNPEAGDYVVAWIGHRPYKETDPSLQLVSPGDWFWVGPGKDLDFFIRRDLSAVRFRGLLAYLGYRQHLSRERFLSLVDEEDRQRIVTQIEALFKSQSRPIEAKSRIGTTEDRANR